MIGKVKFETVDSIISKFCLYLDNGYTYEELHRVILYSFHNNQPFPHDIYNKPCRQNCNLLKQGVMYYHKQLKLINSLPIVNHNIDEGTMTSSETEYYLEPVASYTMNDLLTYFYSKNMADTQEYNPKRMVGIFKHMIDKYGLDKLLFMIEGAARMYESEQKVFSLSDFDSYSSIATHYLDEIRSNCIYSGGGHYVWRKRMLLV